MRDELIYKKDFITTKWSGGETTQLVIYPRDAEFSKKDFLFRISSATFTGTESTFSAFNDYQRYLLPLKGKIEIRHENLYKRVLETDEIEYFDGTWNTEATNTPDCRDYNYIVRKGKIAIFQKLENNNEIYICECSVATVFSMNDIVMEVKSSTEGKNSNDEDCKEIKKLPAETLYFLETENDVVLIKIVESSGPVFISEFKDC